MTDEALERMVRALPYYFSWACGALSGTMSLALLLTGRARRKAMTDEARPIPMLLWCPECRGRHIDEGEFATKPHHTHACQHCGIVWRPATVPTVGVRFLPGFKNASSPEELLARIRQHPHVGAVVAQFQTDMRDGLGLEEYDGESRDRSEIWALLIELLVGAPPEASDCARELRARAKGEP